MHRELTEGVGDAAAPSQARKLPSSQGGSAHVDPILGTYKRAPVEFTHGTGVYLYDATGRRYLDFVSGIAVNALGYADAGLQAAMHRAADGLVHVSNLYASAPGRELAAKLVERSFASKVFF
jgi:acetylornithine/N-succinyldiaminopimelate aminotransferase